MKKIMLMASLLLMVPAFALGNTVASSTMQFQGALTDNGDGTYTGVVPMLGTTGFDIFAEEGETAQFGNDPGSGPVWTPQVIASNDAWPTWTPDTPDWYQYSIEFYEDGGLQRWALRNHPSATATNPWYDEAFWGVGGIAPAGVPMSGVVNWGSTYAAETDVGAYLPATGTPEIPGGAEGEGGGRATWDMDWSWGSEMVPLAFAGFNIDVTFNGTDHDVTLTPAAAPLNVDAGWNAFIIRENATEGPPFIFGNSSYGVDAVEFAIFAGSQKAGLGTNDINGALVSGISTLHVDRLDNVAASGSLYGPYFNVWITDGLGNYAVIANEPSNAEWGGDPWDVSDWNELKTKTCKVYETAGWNTDSSWVHTHIGHGNPFTFEEVGGLMIEPPTPAYIAASPYIGSGAPDEIVTNIAYGYNWIFGDTASNYVTGDGEGFVVNNYYATATFPVNNTTQGIGYGTIAAAMVDANNGDTITVDPGTYVQAAQLVIDKNVTIIGSGQTQTFIVPGFHTGTGAYTQAAGLIYVDYGVTATIRDLAIDGSGYTCHTGIQARGTYLEVRDCEITNVFAHVYDGRGIVFLTGSGLVQNVTMSNIQRIGIHIRGSAIAYPSPLVAVNGLTFTGKGVGDFLDYGVEFGGGGGGSVINSNISGCVGVASTDGSTSAGILVTDYYGTGTVADIDNCTLTGNYTGMAVGFATTDLSQVTIHNSALGGNTDYGIESTGPIVDATGNDWGDTSGPFHASKNPNGTGIEADDFINFTPWTGRTVTLVADLGIDPTSKNLADDGYGFWDGTPALGLDDDYATGFDPGAFQSNITVADPDKYTKYGFVPLSVFGRDVYVGELHSITYHTKIGTDHIADPGDWFAQFYTNGTAHGWYGERINSEPYFSDNLTETPGTWTQWVTEASQPNRLRFFDSNLSLGSYTDGFLQDLTNDPFYADQTIMVFGLGTGTPWAETFDGRLDGLTIELVSGEKVTFNFISGNTFIDAVPADSGPLPCYDTVTLTFNLTTDEFTPDVFGFNAVVRATSEVTFGAITSLQPFGSTTYFFTTDNGDGSWDISASTIGSPSQPIDTAGTHGLFTIVFNTVSEGTAEITYDLLQVRDPNNASIPVVGTGATILVDCTAPAAVTAITAAPRHNKVDVSWTHPGTGVADYLIYRGLWHDGTVGDSAYPEYDDVSTPKPAVRPASVAAADLDPEWILAGSTAVGTNTFTDEGAVGGNGTFDPDGDDRGVYYYEVFPVDLVTNTGPAAAANDRATNYWLGDVVTTSPLTPPNGWVNSHDMIALGTAFGESDGDGQYNNIIDVGPTDDWSRVGIPTTDDVINFEDLMIFSMNFGVVSDAKKGMPISSVVDLAWVRYDDGRQALRLVDGTGVKGLNIRANVRVAGVVAGDLLDAQSDLTFLRNVGENLDVSVAVTGMNVGFTGSGDLLIVDAETQIDITDLTIKVRGHDNSKLEFKMGEATGGSLMPRVFALNPNYPNPFNPMTKISFSLPEAQDVRLEVYGVDGRKVVTLLNETRGPGLHEVIWNGQDDSGRQAASGMYFYRINAGPYSEVRKMTLMK